MTVEKELTRRELVDSAPAPARSGEAPLPAWPLLAVLYGFPIFWVTGASVFAPTLAATIMLTMMVLRGNLRTAPGVLVWASFLIWIGVVALSLTAPLQAVGYVQRAIDLVAIGVALLYYVNARESIRPLMVIRGLAVIWCSLVVLGWLAIYLPNFRFSTPVSYVMPGALKRNELVRELLQPRLAEVQEPWGAEEPFVRPAAPFPYTNSWGMAYALLTPLMVLLWSQLRDNVSRIALGVMLVASVFPAAQTSNRGMLLAVGFVVAYVAFRYLLSGDQKAVLLTVTLVGVSVAGLFAAGAFDAIAARQEVSDSSGTRSSVYAATFEKVLESPIVGWTAPTVDVTIGVPLGTQGYAWMLMYSYGFVGLAIFYLFLVRVLTASLHLRGGAAYVLQGLLVSVALSIWFYGLGSTQCLIVVLVAGMLSRATIDGELDISN